MLYAIENIYMELSTLYHPIISINIYWVNGYPLMQPTQVSVLSNLHNGVKSPCTKS
jgi:hypothetical protein